MFYEFPRTLSSHKIRSGVLVGETRVELKEKVLSAIKELGHKVSASDVAARTGLPLSQCRQLLNKIAFETRAVMEVSPRGEIAYKFFSDLDSVYKLVGLRKILQQVFELSYRAGFFCLRVSFGLLLIASMITIAVVFAIALIFILFGIGAADAGDGDMDFDGDFGLDMDFYDWDMLAVFFSWSILTGGETPTSDGDDEYMGVKIDTPDKGFFNNCFGFLFGEGNPNRLAEQKQWTVVADVIRRNHGVVTAEQIAPYLVKAKADSAAMLATMVRYDGTPEVTAKGNIVYVFPSMQVTAGGVASLQALPEKLEEKEWKFSKIPIERLHWVFFFAGANLCGAYALSTHAAWFEPLLPYQELINWILLYATFFMGFPILREIANCALNAVVEYRNNVRGKAAESLSSPENRFKVDEAQQFAVQVSNLSLQEQVYTTAENILDQDTDGLAAKFGQIETRGGVPNGVYPAALPTAMSNQVAAQPNQYAAAPNQYAATPNHHVAAPNQYAAAPNQYATAQNQYAVAPNQYAAAPNQYAAAQTSDPIRLATPRPAQQTMTNRD